MLPISHHLLKGLRFMKEIYCWDFTHKTSWTEVPTVQPIFSEVPQFSSWPYPLGVLESFGHVVHMIQAITKQVIGAPTLEASALLLLIQVDHFCKSCQVSSPTSRSSSFATAAALFETAG